MNFPITRMRRYRKNSKIRDIVRETKLNKEDLIYPIFVKDGLKDGEKEEISTMPDEYRYSVNDAVEFAKKYILLSYLTTNKNTLKASIYLACNVFFLVTYFEKILKILLKFFCRKLLQLIEKYGIKLL